MVIVVSHEHEHHWWVYQLRYTPFDDVPDDELGKVWYTGWICADCNEPGYEVPA